MEKYIAVIICDIKIQLIVPEKWYGTLDCNGYNRGINKSVKRTVFFSPFGDDVAPDFGIPISPQFQPNFNACYRVHFLQACPTKAACIEYVKNRRVVYPAVYNNRRLLEYIPNPRQIRQRLNSISPPPVAEEIEPAVDDGNVEQNNGAPEIDANIADKGHKDAPENLHDNNASAAAGNFDVDNEAPVIDAAENLHEYANNVPAVASTSGFYSISFRNSFIDLTVDIDEEATALPCTNGGGPSVANAHLVGMLPELACNASAAAEIFQTISNDSSAAFQLQGNRMKTEMKAEIYERLLEANVRNPIVDLTMDPDEAAAFAAVENNFNDDSDDDIQALEQLATPNSFLAIQIKFEFDGNDIVSGDIPFVGTVSFVFALLIMQSLF